MKNYCDIFIKADNAHQHKWCGKEMADIGGKFVCEKHGDYAAAIKTLPFGSVANLPK